MKSIYKTLLPLVSIMFLASCTIVPGSHLSVGDKNEIEVRESIELVNVYPLSPYFVRGYSKSADADGQARINTNLDRQIARYEYRVGYGDILNITIWDHPELTIPAGSYRSAQEAGHWVHSDGRIFYPYIGFVYVQDKTVVEIRKDIASRLAKYVESPQVDVNLAAFRSQKMYVTGEINLPGQQPITNVPLTLLDAINQGGGITDDADWRNVTLTRSGQSESISLYKLMQRGDLTENRLMQAGDIIHVPRNDSQKVFVLGEVEKPNMLIIDRSGMTLTEALSAVGGIDELSADATGVFVIRSAERDAKNADFLTATRQSKGESASDEAKNSTRLVANIYQLDINDASALMTGTEFKLEAYDVVYVTAAPITRWNRVILQTLPTIAGFNQLTEGVLNVRSF